MTTFFMSHSRIYRPRFNEEVSPKRILTLTLTLTLALTPSSIPTLIHCGHEKSPRPDESDKKEEKEGIALAKGCLVIYRTTTHCNGTETKAQSCSLVVHTEEFTENT